MSQQGNHQIDHPTKSPNNCDNCNATILLDWFEDNSWVVCPTCHDLEVKEKFNVSLDTEFDCDESCEYTFKTMRNDLPTLQLVVEISGGVLTGVQELSVFQKKFDHPRQYKYLKTDIKNKLFQSLKASDQSIDIYICDWDNEEQDVRDREGK